MASMVSLGKLNTVLPVSVTAPVYARITASVEWMLGREGHAGRAFENQRHRRTQSRWSGRIPREWASESVQAMAASTSIPR